MKSSRTLPFHTRRDAWVEVNLSAIEHNVLAVRRQVPDPVALMAVIKADAYGHGSIMVLPTLEASGVSMVGVAAMDEAIQIRQAGHNIPILVLGATPDWALHYAAENDIQVTIFSQHHLDSLTRLHEATGAVIQVHIKVDTGMHRIGVPWNKAVAFMEQCRTLPCLQIQGIFSHLAYTGNPRFTQLQLERWQNVLDGLSHPPPWIHLANSSGVWHYPYAGTNMVRVGISLFGYPADELPLPVSLHPAMGLKARIVHLHELPPGEGVSYNQTFQNTGQQPRLIATLPLGYADGIPRNLSNRIQGLCHGQQINQVGNITMDQLMMDVTDVADVRVGDVVMLLGHGPDQAITLTQWATALSTIEYELMCQLRVRLPKTYVR